MGANSGSYYHVFVKTGQSKCIDFRVKSSDFFQIKNYIFFDEEIHLESDRMLVIMSVKVERLLQVSEFTLIFCRFFDRVLSPSIPMFLTYSHRESSLY